VGCDTVIQFGEWEGITLLMEETSYSEMSILIHETTIRCHDPEDHSINPIGYVVDVITFTKMIVGGFEF
jgi:hypothetical protein